MNFKQLLAIAIINFVIGLFYVLISFNDIGFLPPGFGYQLNKDVDVSGLEMSIIWALLFIILGFSNLFKIRWSYLLTVPILLLAIIWGFLTLMFCIDCHRDLGVSWPIIHLYFIPTFLFIIDLLVTKYLFGKKYDS